MGMICYDKLEERRTFASRFRYHQSLQAIQKADVCSALWKGSDILNINSALCHAWLHTVYGMCEEAEKQINALIFARCTPRL